MCGYQNQREEEGEPIVKRKTLRKPGHDGAIENSNLERPLCIFLLVMCIELLLCPSTVPSSVNIMFLLLFLPPGGGNSFQYPLSWLKLMGDDIVEMLPPFYHIVFFISF